MMSMINREKKIGMMCMVIILLNVFIFLSVGLTDEQQELNNQRDKESYSLGYQFGQSLKLQEIDINLDVYTAGVRDAFSGKESLMSQDEIRATILEFQKRIMAARQKEFQEKAQKNLAEGKAFLEENKKKEGVKTLPSGLQYKVLAEGLGKMPKATDTVTVHYRGTLINGTEFDSSYKRGQPATFPVNGVIRGWTEAVQLMKEGAKWQLFVPPQLGYGEQGAGPIPPNSLLIFEVELLAIK